MPQPLTIRQRAVLEFVSDTIRDTSVAPSIAEICRHVGLTSLSTVHKHLTSLEANGYITRRWNRSRSITLLWQAECCPTCGQLKPATERAEAV